MPSRPLFSTTARSRHVQYNDMSFGKALFKCFINVDIISYLDKVIRLPARSNTYQDKDLD